MIRFITKRRFNGSVLLIMLALFFCGPFLESHARAEKLWLITELNTEVYQGCKKPCWKLVGNGLMEPSGNPFVVNQYVAKEVAVPDNVKTKFLEIKLDGDVYYFDPRHNLSHVLYNYEYQRCLMGSKDFRIPHKKIKKINECRKLVNLERKYIGYIEDYNFQDKGNLSDLRIRLDKAVERRKKGDFKDYKAHISAATTIVNESKESGLNKKQKKSSVIIQRKSTRVKRKRITSAKQPSTRKSSSTNSTLKKLRGDISRQSQRIQDLTIENNRLGKSLTRQNSRIKALENRVRPLKKLTDNAVALQNKLTAIEKNVGQFTAKFKNTDSDNDTILSTIGDWQDVIPRLKRKIEALESKLGDVADSNKPNNTENNQQANVDNSLAERASSVNPSAGRIVDEKNDKNIPWFLLSIIGGVLLAGIAGGGLVFLWVKRRSTKEEQMFSQRTRTRNRTQPSADRSNFAEIPRSDKLSTSSNSRDSIQTNIIEQSVPQSNELVYEDRDFLSLCKSSLTNPAAIDILKRGGVIGLRKDTSSTNASSIILVIDNSRQIEDIEFWALANPDVRGGTDFIIVPGIMQNKRASFLVADDGVNALREFKGIFDIRPGSSFDLLTAAHGTRDGNSFKIIQQGVVQLPS